MEAYIGSIRPYDNESLVVHPDACFLNPYYHEKAIRYDIALLRIPYSQRVGRPSPPYQYNSICLVEKSIKNESTRLEIAGMGLMGRPQDLAQQLQMGRLDYEPNTCSLVDSEEVICLRSPNHAQSRICRVSMYPLKGDSILIQSTN